MTSIRITADEARRLIDSFGLVRIDEDGDLVWFCLSDSTDDYIHAVIFGFVDELTWFEHRDQMGDHS